MSSKWDNSINQILRRNILFYYLTPGWRDTVFKHLYDEFTKRGILYVATSSWVNWRIILKDGTAISAVPQNNERARGYKGDVLVFEEGVSKEWFDLSIGRNRWYDNGMNFILEGDTGVLVDGREYFATR